ncbi:putative cilia-and flagella-associated protein 20/C3orf67 [Plasmopara halstedii]
MLEKDAMSAASKEVTSESCWRVVVTKHIVDHNHNLSRELYQHYCENRRIYDPELLAIDTSNTSIVTTHKTGSSSLQKHDGMVTDADRPNIQSNESQLHPKSVLSMQLEAGLAEAVSQAHLLSLSGINQSTSFGMSGVPASLASASIAQQTVPSVVLLPYSSTISYLPTQAQTSQQGLLQQQHEVQQQHTQPAFMNAENIGQHSATVASNAINSANVVLFNNSGMTVTSTLPPSGSSVISRACRVHGSSVGTDDGTMGFTDNQATQCSCFRIAGGGNYVTIVPASEPMGSTDTLVNSDEDAKMFAETDGVWQPSSKLEIEKVTTESGATIWRVPRILRRYPTWDIFHKYLDTYSIATFQLYRVRTTYSVRSRNIRLRQLAASRGLVVREGGNDDASETEQEGDHGISRAHLVPEEYDWYSKTFLCTHGWKRRSRGRGQRLSHNVRATECPAKVCATLQRTDGSSNWSVVVTKHLAEHNHELSEALYQQYSEVRRVRDPAVLARAEHLWRTGATRRRVFEFLKEQSPNQLILMKDVHNLVQRWQTQERRPRLEGESETQSHVYVQQPGSKPMSIVQLEMTYFQGGDFIELLSAQGKSPAAAWKIQGKVSKTFDKGIKGNVFLFDGNAETKMQLPKTTSCSLGLTQRFVLLQLFVPFTRSLSVEMCFADVQKVRRRFVIASAFRELVQTTLHVQLPLTTTDVPRDEWVNLVFDLQTLAALHFPTTKYRSLESISVSGTCRLKRIFTMKDAPTPSIGSQFDSYADSREIPRQFGFSAKKHGSNDLQPVITLYFAETASSVGRIKGLAVPAKTSRKASVQRRESVHTRQQTDSTKSHSRALTTDSMQEPQLNFDEDSNSRRESYRRDRGLSSREHNRVVKVDESSVKKERKDKSFEDFKRSSFEMKEEEILAATSPECRSADEFHRFGNGHSHVVESSSTSRCHSETEPENLRQSILGEIQQKIAILEAQDEQNDQRDQKLFLRHTSIHSGEWHLQQLQDEDMIDRSLLSDDEDDDLQLSVSWRRELREANAHESSSSFTLAQDSKDKEKMSASDLNEKSIFAFPRLMEPQSVSTAKQSDFDLLQDCKPSLGHEERDKFTIKSVTQLESQDVCEFTNEDDDDDLELLNLLAAKRLKRQLTLQEPSTSGENGTYFHQISQSSLSKDADQMNKVRDSIQLVESSCSPPSIVAKNGASLHAASYIEKNQGDGESEDDLNGLSIDLTNELRVSADHGHNTKCEENITIELSPANSYTDKINFENANLNDKDLDDKDSSFDFADLVDKADSIDSRNEDEIKEDHIIANSTIQEKSAFSKRQYVPASPRTIKPIAFPMIKSPQTFRNNQVRDITPTRSTDVSSSLSSRRLQSLLESTDWNAELDAQVSRSTDSSSLHRSTLKANIQRPEQTSSSHSQPSLTSSVELVYDPILRCYYDPVANKYYALAN